MEATVIGALILASAGLVASVLTTAITSFAEYRLAWHDARRPHYIALVEASARSQDVQDQLADLLRDKASNFRVIAAQRQIKRDVKQSAMDLRRELFAVQLVATPKVFHAADWMVTVMTAGAVVLGRLSEEKGTWPATAAHLDRLSDDLFEARTAFIAEARRELRLKPLGQRASGSAAVEEVVRRTSEG